MTGTTDDGTGQAGTGEGGAPGGGGGGLTEDRVQAMIREALQGVTAQPPAGSPRATPATAPAGPVDITGQVRAAVEQVARERDAQAAVDARLSAIEEAAKKITEAAPVKFKPVTLRWWADREPT